MLPDDPEWDVLVGEFSEHPAARAIIRARVERVSSTCGFAVPFMSLVGERPTLDQANGRKDEDALADYRAEKNAVSIDGLPGLD